MGRVGATGAARPRDAADLAFMISTSRVDDLALLRRVAHDLTGLEPGDIVEDGYIVEASPGEGRVRVTRARRVADEVSPGPRYTCRTVRYESEDMPFGRFAAEGWLDEAVARWGDGDADARQVGNASAEASPDGTRAVARVDAAARPGGWPRRARGSHHDDLEAALDSSGRLRLASESLGVSYEGDFLDTVELVELGMRCREAGIEP